MRQPRQLPERKTKGEPTGSGGEEKNQGQKKEKIGQHIAKLNKKHAIIMLGGKCVILNDITDPTFNRPDITFSSVNDFRNYYSNKKVFIKTTKGISANPVANLWLDSPKRRQYEGIVFAPGKDVSGYYNLFRGFSVKPVKGDWSLFDSHMRDVIANGNVQHYSYIRKWFARLLRKPGDERPGTSIALRGEMGTGKGVFVSQFGEIIGSHFLYITNQKQLTGRFNNHLKDALLVFCDEALWGGDKPAEGVLKGMITEKYIMVEPKGKDAFPVKNHIHLVVASTGEWIVPAGLEERRFLVLDVSNRHKQDHEYFGAIFHQMDHGGREAMLYDLLEEKIDINLRKIPRTAVLLDQVVHTMPTAHKFWLERLRAGDPSTWPEFVMSEFIYMAYLEFATACGDRYKLIDIQLGKELRRLCPSLQRKKKRFGGIEKYVLFLPTLEVCRKFFEKAVGVPIDWDLEKDEDEDE